MIAGQEWGSDSRKFKLAYRCLASDGIGIMPVFGYLDDLMHIACLTAFFLIFSRRNRHVLAMNDEFKLRQ